MLTGLTRFFTDLPNDDCVATACAPNCYMIRRNVLRSIGGQDVATFPFHHEEADWSFRAAKIGFKSYVARDAREWHKTPAPKRRPIVGSGDFSIDDPDRAYFHARSRALLARRHANCRTAGGVLYDVLSRDRRGIRSDLRVLEPCALAHVLGVRARSGCRPDDAASRAASAAITQLKTPGS